LDAVRLAVNRRADGPAIPDIAAIHISGVEGQRERTRAVDRDDPARAVTATMPSMTARAAVWKRSTSMAQARDALEGGAVLNKKLGVLMLRGS
jgi:hypothetical protein